MYAMSIFLYHCLNYSFIAHRNFPLQSSSYEKGGTTVLSGNILYASINTGSITGYRVAIPTASYLVSNSDINRILALRSDAFPKSNSGLFRIMSATLLPTNSVTIDYRVNSGVLPPGDDTLRWRIYEAETVVARTWFSSSNSQTQTSGSSVRTGYGSYDAGNGTLISSASRVFLQSPDESSWQVRLCLESDMDVKSGSAPVGFSIAPGFYTAVPPLDQPNTKTLHGGLYYDTTQSIYRGTVVGLAHLSGTGANLHFWTSGQWRINMWGNDFDGTCIMVNRGLTLPHSGWAAFGFPEDEQLVPPNPVTMERLFVMGSPRALGTLNWRSDFFSPSQTDPPSVCAVAWSEANGPIPASLSTYADLTNQTTHIRNIAQAGTSSFGGFAEVIDVELISGMYDTIQAPTTSSIFTFQPRRIGRFPMARLGAGKFPTIPSSVGYTTWSHSPDSATAPLWLHTEGGVFLPWGGPPLSGSTTGATIWVTSGSMFDGEGVTMYQGNMPGLDPEGDPEPVPHDIDATRYRKTYSYFRQPVVETTVVKGGSNRPR